MQELADDDPPDVLKEICAICSPPHPLYPHEIAAEVINAVFIDYQARRPPGQVSFVLCAEHRALFIENMNADKEQAALRRASLEEDPGLKAKVNCQSLSSPSSPTCGGSSSSLPYPREYPTICWKCLKPITIKVNMDERGERSWTTDHDCHD